MIWRAHFRFFSDLKTFSISSSQDNSQYGGGLAHSGVHRLKILLAKRLHFRTRNTTETWYMRWRQTAPYLVRSTLSSHFLLCMKRQLNMSSCLLQPFKRWLHIEYLVSISFCYKSILYICNMAILCFLCAVHRNRVVYTVKNKRIVVERKWCMWYGVSHNM